MKTSHLQLEWVRYPQASYEAIPSEESEFPTAKTKLDARVTYALDGNHFAWLKIRSGDEEMRAYNFELEAVATFQFDLNVAMSAYKVANDKLPKILAVNIIRMLYASAREMLAVLTARAPHGSVVIESVLIEPSDVEIGSDVSPEVVLRELFKVMPDAATAPPALISEKAVPKRRAKAKAKPATAGS